MRVLVVDDFLSYRMLTVHMLEKRGHFVKTVANGREAIAQLEKEDFDLVLMDVQMPVLDGIEATRIIRNLASPVRRHDVPVIAVSSIRESDGVRRCLEAGMNGFLSKPVKSGDFVEAVEQYGCGKI